MLEELADCLDCLGGSEGGLRNSGWGIGGNVSAEGAGLVDSGSIEGKIGVSGLNLAGLRVNTF